MPELPQSHIGDEPDGTLFHDYVCVMPIASERFDHFVSRGYIYDLCNFSFFKRRVFFISNPYKNQI